MRFIDWNISYAGDTHRKIEYLKSYICSEMCIMLQEVKPHACECIKTVFADKFSLFYSLDYRKPGKFDSDARKLGVLVMVSKDIGVAEAGVVERSPFPDRTMYITLNNGIKILVLHSLTGCGYYRTKSVQFDSFAEFIDMYRPDIIGIDANEPQKDHFDIKQMQFFDNGLGAKHFFDAIVDIGLVDSFVRKNGHSTHEEGQPLTTSHIIHGKGAVRYDFLFARDCYEISSLEYNYDDAVKSGSDHAIIVGDIVI